MDRRIKEARVVPPGVRRNLGIAVFIVGCCLIAFLYHLSPQSAILFAIDLALVGIGLLIFLRTQRQSFRAVSVIALLTAHLAIIGYATYFTTNPNLTMLANNMMMAGAWLASYGCRHRVGTSLHCINCDYPHNDQPYCPECNADWSAGDSLVRGERARDTACITLGSLCILLWLAVAFGPIASTIYAKKVPTAVLMRIASTPGGSATHFYELSNRTLSPAERDTLAAMLLDSRDRVGELDISQERWLNDASAASTISSSLVERHLSGLYTLRLADSTTARVGAPTRLDVIINTKSHSFLSGREMHLWRDGLWLAGTRTAEPDESWQPMSEVHNYVDESGDPTLPPLSIAFTPAIAGRQDVKVICWLAWFNRPVPQRPGLGSIVVVPPPAALWSKRIELSTTIDVQP